MSRPNSDEAFVDHITSAQQALFAYILILLPNIADASDVLQETNLVLWRKRGEFRPEEEFLPWARAIARYQALASLKKQHRHRIRFSDNLLSQLAEEPHAPEAQGFESEQAFLGECIDELAPSSQELLRLRYSSALSLGEIAGQTSRSEGAVRGALYRIRGELANCIRRKLHCERRTQ
jgi:RNA polymerase sigma-70 factor (ECF subfamily)